MSFRDSQSFRYYGSTPNSEPTPGKRTVLQRKTKEKHEDNEESPQTPDSTTEPPKPAHDFQEGDDVFFLNDEGVNILGTIGKVTPSRCQILFDDGTVQWAPFKRMKKLSCSFSEPAASFEAANRESEAKSAKKIKTDLMCIVCNEKRKISTKKALTYDSTSPFTCAKCTAAKVVPTPAKVNNSNLNEGYQKKTSNQYLRTPVRRNNSPHSAPTNSLPAVKAQLPLPPRGHHVDAGSRPQQQRMAYFPPQAGTSFTTPTQPPAYFNQQQQQKLMPSSPATDGSRPGGTQMTLKPMKTSVSVQLKTSPNKNGTKSNHCFHCGERTCPYNRVHCHMCERYCHHMCLQLTPTPLEGDKFWDVMCSACGTQNGNDKEPNRVFSVRRNINTWSDVVHLIINCLKVKAMGQQYFDFDTQIIPFFDENINKLHLPRVYKLATREERKSKLLDALTGSGLRFTKRKSSAKISAPLGDTAGKTLWALRSDKPNSDSSSPETPPSTNNARAYPPNRNLMTSPTNANSSSQPQNNLSKPQKSVPDEVSITPSPVTPISPTKTSSLPLVLQNRISGSPSSSLSIFPIPNPRANPPGITSNTSNSSLSYPRVLSKEVVLRSPITTNIVLSSTTTTTTAGLSKTLQCPSPKQAPPAGTTSMGGQGNTYQSKDGSGHKTPDKESSNHRQRLRLRIPLKPPSKEPSKLSPVTKPDLSTPTKQKMSAVTAANNSTKVVTPSTEAGFRPRKRLMPSDDEQEIQEDTGPPPAKQSKLSVSPTMPLLTKEEMPFSRGEGGRDQLLKSPERKSLSATMGAIGRPTISPLRLKIQPVSRGRPKLLRSSVLNKTNLASKSVRGKGGVVRGRGRPLSSSKLIPPKESSNSSQNSNDSSSRSSTFTPNGIWKSETTTTRAVPNGASSNGNTVNGLKIRKVPYVPPPPPTLPPDLSEARSEEPDPSEIIARTVCNAIALGGLRVRCLLPFEQPAAEVKKSVAEFFQEESSIQITTNDKNNSDTDEQENFHAEKKKKPPRNRFNKTLDDLDSYEIAATKVGPDGVKRYLAVWKEPVRGNQLDFDEEIERMFFQQPRESLIKQEPMEEQQQQLLERNNCASNGSSSINSTPSMSLDPIMRTLNGNRSGSNIKPEYELKRKIVVPVGINLLRPDGTLNLTFVPEKKDNDCEILTPNKSLAPSSSVSSSSAMCNNIKVAIPGVTCLIDLTSDSP